MKPGEGHCREMEMQEELRFKTLFAGHSLYEFHAFEGMGGRGCRVQEFIVPEHH